MSQAKRAANMHKIVYKKTSYDASYSASIVDRGANGGIAGDDVSIVEQLHRSVDIQGINNHQFNNMPIITDSGVVKSQRGDIIVILHQYSYMGKGPPFILQHRLNFSRTMLMTVPSKLEVGS